MKIDIRSVLWLCLLCFILFTLAACTQTPSVLLEIPERLYALGGQEQVDINLANGSIEIIYSKTNQLVITGSLPEDLRDELILEQNDNGLAIRLSGSAQQLKRSLLKRVSLVVTVPEQTHVIIATFDADISASGAGADLTVTSVGGGVKVSGFEGKVMIKANRGTVNILNSSGVFGVSGNYGAITFSQVIGDISASTIMGQISYSGKPSPGDSLRFENDHGPVVITIPLDSSLEVSMNSANGEVICVIPGLASSSRTCQGKMNSGQADLYVRTVSGKITLQRSGE